VRGDKEITKDIMNRGGTLYITFTFSKEYTPTSKSNKLDYPFEYSFLTEETLQELRNKILQDLKKSERKRKIHINP